MEAGRQIRRLLQPPRQEIMVAWTKKVVIEVESRDHVLNIF